MIGHLALAAFALFLILFGAGIYLEDRRGRGKGLALAGCGAVLLFHLATT